MDEKIQSEIIHLLDKSKSVGSHEDVNTNAVLRCNNILTVVTTMYPIIQFLKIHNTVLFEATEAEHVIYFDLSINEDEIIKDIAPMAPIEISFEFSCENPNKYVMLHRVSLVVKIIISDKFPNEIPLVKVVSTENLSKGDIKQFNKFCENYEQTNAGNDSFNLFEFLLDCPEFLESLAKKRFREPHKKFNEYRPARNYQSPANYQRRITSDLPTANPDDNESSFDKVIRILIEDNDHGTQNSLMSAYKFEMGSIMMDLDLYEPKIKRFHHKFGPLSFSSDVIDFKAYKPNVGKNPTHRINSYRVTLYQFDLAQILDKFPDTYKELYPIIKKILLGLKDMQERIYNQKFSKVLHIGIIPKTETVFRVIVVKECLPTHQKDNFFNTFEEFVQISSLIDNGKKNIYTDSIANYVLKMYDLLNSFHQTKTFHGHLDVQKVFLTSNGDVVLYDSFYETFIAEVIPSILEMTIQLVDTNRIKLRNGNVDVAPKIIKEMMSNDVFNFGLFMYFLFVDSSNFTSKFQLFQSENRNSENLESILHEIDSLENADLRHLIKSCISLDKQCRPTMQEIAEYRFVAMLKNDNFVDRKEVSKDLEFMNTVNKNYLPRLQHDFRVITKLGSGGYGTVIKVSRPIEGGSSFYAIKLCKFRRDKLESTILETRCLSQLNHPNVVRYYSCWFEYKTNVEDFIRNSEHDSETMHSRSDSISSDLINIDSQNKFTLDMNVFCIQMELCESLTLFDYLQSPEKLPKSKESIFSDIVKGLSYIHENTIIHRDLKPNNIMFDLNHNAKIGDFGLSCLCDSKELEDKLIVKKQELSYDMGTHFYTAPEMHKKTYFNTPCKIKGFNSDGPYTTKVDIYSLGIILFELYYPLKTGMERSMTLTNLRKQEPEFPKDIDRFANEDEKKLISKLLSFDPDDRPTAMELNYFYVESKGEMPIDAQIMKKIITVPSLLQPMVKMIFNMPTSLSKSFINSRYDSLKHDLKIGEIQINDNYYDRIRKIQLTKSYARIIAGIYGTDDIPIPSIMPKTHLEPKDDKTIDMRTCFNWYLMDQNGIIVSLPYHIRAHLASHVAQSNQHIVLLRRSSIDKCFMQMMDPYAIQEIHEITFDMVWPKDWCDETKQILPYCEILGFAYHLIVYFVLLANAMIDCYSKSPTTSLCSRSLKTSGINISFYLTNMTIFREVMEFLNITEEESATIIHLLCDNEVQLLKQDPSKFRRDFQLVADKGSNPNLLTKMRHIFELMHIVDTEADCFLESIGKTLSKYYRKSLVAKFITKITPFVEDMKTIVGLTRLSYFEFNPHNYDLDESDWNGRKNLFEFVYSFGFISKNSFFYNHIMINVVVRKNDEDPITIGYGGRYDNLMQNFVKKQDHPPSPSKKRKEGPHVFSAYKNAIGISFDLHDLCNLIPSNVELDQVTNFNQDFIESCQKYVANQIRTLFPSNQSYNGMTTLDIMICCFAPEKKDFEQYMPVCSLANQLRMNGFSVAVLPEVASEDYIKINSRDISNSRLNWCLQQDTQWLIAIQSFGLNESYFCFQRVINSANNYERVDDYRIGNWFMKTFEEFEQMYHYLFQKLSIKVKRDDSVRSTDSTEMDFSSLNIEIYTGSDTADIKGMKKQDRSRILEMIKSELKRMPFLNLANLNSDNLKIMAFNLPPSVIRAIVETIQLSRIQSTCQQFKDRQHIKLKTLINNFIENVGKNRELLGFREQIEKCITDSCNFFADKFLKSPGKHSILILFPISFIDQYRIIFA